ncbi:ExeM/NucH family extracellular endonuclease, partial [bacterium]|nr:ExeM/NucH family extracellular endonuclease [bacterium]
RHQQSTKLRHLPGNYQFLSPLIESHLILFLSLCITLNIHGVVWISEIRTNQPGVDSDEYFELYASNSEDNLANLTYLVIGDGPEGSGVIEAVVRLNEHSFSEDNPFFLTAESSFTLKNTTADNTTSLNFENDDNVTHLLVEAFTGNGGDDLDSDDDGTLDTKPWSTIIDGVSLIETVGTEDHAYASTLGLQSVGPNGSFAPAHVFRTMNTGVFSIGGFNLGENDTPRASNSTLRDSGIMEKAIPEIQGMGMTSPFVGMTIKTTGIVVGDFQSNDELRGFFLQDPRGDGNPASSDGIFVFDPAGLPVSVGERVEVIGTITEFNHLTEINQVSSLKIVGTGTVSPTNVRLPEKSNGDLERYEGMLIQIMSQMTVSQNFFLGRYGQMTLSSPDDSGLPGRLFQATHFFPPGSDANQWAADNQRRILILDDGQDIDALGDNPNPIPYMGPSPGKIIRNGDRVDHLIGVLDYGRINSNRSDPARDYRLHPTIDPLFTPSSPRPSSPPVIGGNLKVASFNVLNYFLTLNQRGADTSSERARQREKIIAAMHRMDADIFGLIEVENDKGASVQDLVNGLNGLTGLTRPVYDSIKTGRIGLDAIKVGIIYKPAKVILLGGFKILDDAIDPRALSTRNRPPLAQTFQHRATGDALTVVVNHFKSKGSPCDDINDPDRGDGQGNCNGARESIARAMVDWLESDTTSSGDSDIIIIGDLNAYAKEDPIQTLEKGGFVNLIHQFRSTDAYSFTFDGQAGYLDHVLASPSLANKAVSVAEWHINTDEPSVRNYNEDTNQAGYYERNEFRSSDHDPIILGLQMTSKPSSTNDSIAKVIRISQKGPSIRVDFSGIPGHSYQVEFTASLTAPHWRPIGTVLADAHGRIEFIDLNPMNPIGFYRPRL